MDDIARCMQRMNDLESELRRHRKGGRIAGVGVVVIGVVVVASGQSKTDRAPPPTQQPGEVNGGQMIVEAPLPNQRLQPFKAGYSVSVQAHPGQFPGFHPIEMRQPAASDTSEVAMNTHSLRIVDADSKVRMVLSTYETDKYPYLAFYDAQGNEKLVVSLDAEGRGSIAIHDSEGRNAIVLGLDESGSPAVVVKAGDVDKAGIGSHANAGRIWWRDEHNGQLSPAAREAKP